LKRVLAVTLAVTSGLGMVGVTLAHMSRQTPESRSGGMMDPGMGMMGGGPMGEMMPMMQMMQACTQMMQQMSAMMGQYGPTQPQVQESERK